MIYVLIYYAIGFPLAFPLVYRCLHRYKHIDMGRDGPQLLVVATTWPLWGAVCLYSIIKKD